MEKKNPGGYMFSNADLRKLIFPLVAEQILVVSVDMVDIMTVSSVGEAATSGVSLVDMINTPFINIFAAVVIGGVVVSSQYLGQKRWDWTYQSADQLLVITGMLSLGIMILCILFRKGFLSLIYQGVVEDVMRNARVYLVISALSYPFLSVYNSCAALFRSMGNSKISTQASIIMNVINMIGDPLFIPVFCWGTAGAALISLISCMTACFILSYRPHNRSLDLYIGAGFKTNRRMMKQTLSIGIPDGIESSIFQLGRMLVVGIIAMFGTTQTAANAIANNLGGMGAFPGQVMSLAIITVVGRLVGAGDFNRAECYVRKMMKLTYVVSGLCCITAILTMPLILRLYSLPPEALCMGAILVPIHNGRAIFIWPCSSCLANMLRATNDVKFPMCVSTMSMILFHIGFNSLLVVGLGLGAMGVWWAMIADWVVRSAFFGWRFFSGKWKRFYHAM